MKRFCKCKFCGTKLTKRGTMVGVDRPVIILTCPKCKRNFQK